MRTAQEFFSKPKQKRQASFLITSLEYFAVSTISSFGEQT
jgi:hypothetical protein